VTVVLIYALIACAYTLAALTVLGVWLAVRELVKIRRQGPVTVTHVTNAATEVARPAIDRAALHQLRHPTAYSFDRKSDGGDR
jgi:hypothetical protein